VVAGSPGQLPAAELGSVAADGSHLPSPVQAVAAAGWAQGDVRGSSSSRDGDGPPAHPATGAWQQEEEEEQEPEIGDEVCPTTASGPPADGRMFEFTIGPFDHVTSHVSAGGPLGLRPSPSAAAPAAAAAGAGAAGGGWLASVFNQLQAHDLMPANTAMPGTGPLSSLWGSTAGAAAAIEATGAAAYTCAPSAAGTALLASSWAAAAAAALPVPSSLVKHEVLPDPGAPAAGGPLQQQPVVDTSGGLPG
jgi:hypothetical protein